jgi:hypothetical protein
MNEVIEPVEGKRLADVKVGFAPNADGSTPEWYSDFLGKQFTTVEELESFFKEQGFSLSRSLDKDYFDSKGGFMGDVDTSDLIEQGYVVYELVSPTERPGAVLVKFAD